MEDGLFPDPASAAGWLLTPGADVREWLYGLEPARIAALGAPSILYADKALLPRDARSAVPLLLLSSATEFSGLVRDDLRPASGPARPFCRARAASPAAPTSPPRVHRPSLPA